MMKNIHEAQMFVNLVAADQNYADGLDNETIETLQRIAIERHCGNGYFSMDGILDDLTVLTGDEEIASHILNEAA